MGLIICLGLIKLVRRLLRRSPRKTQNEHCIIEPIVRLVEVSLAEVGKPRPRLYPEAFGDEHVLNKAIHLGLEIVPCDWQRLRGLVVSTPFFKKKSIIFLIVQTEHPHIILIWALHDNFW